MPDSHCRSCIAMLKTRIELILKLAILFSYLVKKEGLLYKLDSISVADKAYDLYRIYLD